MDYMKLKKKGDQSVEASVLLRRWNKIIMGGGGTWEEEKRGAGKEGARIKCRRRWTRL